MLKPDWCWMSNGSAGRVVSHLFGGFWTEIVSFAESIASAPWPPARWRVNDGFGTRNRRRATSRVQPGSFPERCRRRVEPQVRAGVRGGADLVDGRVEVDAEEAAARPGVNAGPRNGDARAGLTVDDRSSAAPYRSPVAGRSRCRRASRRRSAPLSCGCPSASSGIGRTWTGSAGPGRWSRTAVREWPRSGRGRGAGAAGARTAASAAARRTGIHEEASWESKRTGPASESSTKRFVASERG